MPRHEVLRAFHPDRDEAFFVLAGQVRIYGDDGQVVADLGHHQGVLIPKGFRYWFESVGDARSEIESLLETSPSLKPEAGSALALALRQGSKKAVFDLEKYGEVDPNTLARIQAKTYTVDQVLDDWFPPEPPSRAE